MNTPCIIVNMSGPLAPDRFGNERVIGPMHRPSYVHDDLEAARKEALRLHKQHASANGRFVIFQAVEVTEWRTPFEIAAPTVAVLEPYERPVAPISQTVACVLKEGDIRQAGDEYYDGKWKPIPEDRHGLPIFPGSFPHRRPCSHTSEKTKRRRKKA